MKYLFLSLCTALFLGFGLYAQSNTATEADDFLIEIEQQDGQIMLKCKSGCAWEELSFNAREKEGINQFGMTELEENAIEPDPELADFLFTISPKGEGMELKGMQGTNWKTLSYTCRPANCYQTIDRSGMVSIH